jgi:endoglucanase
MTALAFATLALGSHSVLAAESSAAKPAAATAASQTNTSVASPINDFTNEDWLNGVYRKAAGFSIPATQTNQNAFKPKAKVLLATGEVVLIKQVQIGEKNMAVWVDSPLLDGNTVGYPRRLTVGLNGSDPVLPKVAPQEEFSTRLNNITNEDWLKGVYRKAAGFSIPLTAMNRKGFKPGATVRLGDGQELLVKSAQVVGSSMSVFLDSPPLNPERVGYPKRLRFIAPAP